MMTDFFCFKALSGSESFRLIEVQPGAFAHPIHCKIREWPLHNAPNYEALSYAWGPQAETGPFVVLDGSPFQISTELEIAIRRLRQTNNTRTLWIDAICINQGNIRERNAQVAVMRDIYKGADCVIAWLGDDSHDSRRALKFLEEMARIRNEDLQSTTINGVWQGEPWSDDDSEAERSSFDWTAQARVAEHEFLGTTESEPDMEAQESDPLIRRRDSADTLSESPQRGGIRTLVMYFRDRWTRMKNSLSRGWRDWKKTLLHPIQTWMDNRQRNKRWKLFYEERDDNQKRAGHLVTGVPILHYMFGHPLEDLFSDERQADWEALDALLERPWFSRTWVVQEVWNSTNCIMQCGSSRLKWKRYVLAMDFQEAWDDMGYLVRETERWKRWPSLKRRYGLAIHIAKQRVYDEGGSKLSDVLWNTWDREATDPRDKVFAVLGLVGYNQNAPLPRVDYSKPVQQVYKEAAAFIIGKDRKLDLLLGARGLRSADIDGIPSWAPDWRRAGNDQRPALFVNGSKMRILSYFSGSTDMVLLHGHGYSASARSEPITSFSSDLSLLTVRAFVLDTIAYTGPKGDDYDKGAEEIIDVAQTTITNFLFAQTSPTIRRRATVDEEELRVILRAGTHVPHRNSEAYDGDEDQIIENIMRDRLFFVTENGHLCVGPSFAREGDAVVIIAGCNFPMVLRRRGERFALVGEAYGKHFFCKSILRARVADNPSIVHHNMAGEALKKSRLFGLIKKRPEWVDMSIE